VVVAMNKELAIVVSLQRSTQDCSSYNQAEVYCWEEAA